AGILNAMERAGKINMRLGPECLHHTDLLLRSPAAIREVLVECRELDLVPTDTDAKAEPAAGEHIETRRLFGHQHRLALRKDQHARGEADALRAARKKTKQHERIMIGGRARTDTVAPGCCRIGPEHMIR